MGDIVRLGSNEPRKTDVRFVSATNRNLKEMIAEGRFRDDLFFRIKGAEIHIPPLRERREDVRSLVNHALGQYAAELERPIPGISDPLSVRLCFCRERKLFVAILERIQRFGMPPPLLQRG